MINALLLTLTLAGGQTLPTSPAPQTAPRDTSAVKATAVIKGKVTSGENGRPLRRAQINISAPELTASRSTSTSPQGTYEFKDLPAGRYTIRVSRNGHLTLQYGQKRPGEPGKPLQIEDGQTVEKLDFALPRAGVISGRITDETGDAFAGVQVFAMQPQYWMGRRRLVPISSSIYSDDVGQFRIVGLPPGDYFVMANVKETWVADEKTKRVFSYSPTYSGGTPSQADAQRIKVGVGTEVAGVDISMIPVPASTLSGSALGSDGTPLAGGNVSLNSEITGPGGGSYSGVGSSPVAADGTWKIKDVPPGEFQLTARSASRDKAMETATMTIVVAGDTEGISLLADAGATISGKVVTDDGAPLPESRSLRIYGRTVVPGRREAILVMGDDNGLVRTDGSFTLKGISGPTVIQVQSLPRGWAAQSIEIGEKDYITSAIDLRSGQDAEGVKITITKNFPAVVGQIADEKGNPAEGTVLLFPADSAKWLEAAGQLRLTRPDQTGRFRFAIVPPGDYLAIALEYVQQWQVNDPDYLDELKGDATKVRVVPGTNEPLVLTLKKPMQ
jgi:Carboxypeptidase regulatory-like domain